MIWHHEYIFIWLFRFYGLGFRIYERRRKLQEERRGNSRGIVEPKDKEANGNLNHEEGREGRWQLDGGPLIKDTQRE